MAVVKASSMKIVNILGSVVGSKVSEQDVQSGNSELPSGKCGSDVGLIDNRATLAVQLNDFVLRLTMVRRSSNQSE